MDQVQATTTVVTPEENTAFLSTGQNLVTALAQTYEQLNKWRGSFEARGGHVTYANDDILAIVYIGNDLDAWWKEDPARQATIARLRTDV